MTRSNNVQSLRLACTLLSLLLVQSRCEAASKLLHPLLTVSSPSFGKEVDSLLLDLRGGASSSSSSSSSKTKKKKSSKKSSKSSSGGGTKSKKKSKSKKKVEDSDAGDNSDDNLSEEKAAIGEAMEKDAAEALGDAIRSRAEELRNENPLLSQIDQSVYSVGWALGASDRRSLGEYIVNLETEATEEDGGVAGSPSSVLVNYFLKSHGGAHALQCLCSLLASSAGFASMFVSAQSPMQRVLLQRALLFAMTKHVAGLLGAAFIAAKAIPQVGLRKARVWMEQLAMDPVSQYVFYSACILLWLPTNDKVPLLFAGNLPWVSTLLVGPILLREVVSTLLVASDVLVLWATSNNNDQEEEDDVIQTILQTSQKSINIVMSLLVTPEKWRSADPAVRQRILAKLTSKVSLALEVMVGAVILLDALVLMGRIVFGNASLVKPPFGMVIKRLLCSRLFLQYLWTRKRKINRLAMDIRGGAAELPFYLLDVLVDPRAAMGLPERSAVRLPVSKGSANIQKFSWKEYILIALGLDE